jgi:hypothetical protein
VHIVPKGCQERAILEARARADLGLYILAVKQLEQPLTQESFDWAYECSERARVIYEQARDALMAHIAAHGC